MTHVCNICDKTFIYESLLLRHKNRKTPCKNKNNINKDVDKDVNINDNIKNNNKNNNKDVDINDNIKNNINYDIKDNNKDNKKYKDKDSDEEDEDLICDFCSKKFVSKARRDRHMDKSCEEKRRTYAELDYLNNRNSVSNYIRYIANNFHELEDINLINKNKRMNENISNNATTKTTVDPKTNTTTKTTVDPKTNTTSTSISNTNNTNIDIDIIINVNSNRFIGQEDIPYILSTFSNFTKLIDFIKEIHADELNKPNVHIKYVCCYDNNKWHFKRVM